MQGTAKVQSMQPRAERSGRCGARKDRSSPAPAKCAMRRTGRARRQTSPRERRASERPRVPRTLRATFCGDERRRRCDQRSRDYKTHAHVPDIA